jgi:hypothetical protein
MPFTLDLIPSEQEQDWLIKQLARLVKQAGYESFLRGAIVEPSPACFPEPWVPDLRGARAVIERLMQAAGLGHLSVEIEEFSVDAPGAAIPAEQRTVVGWFEGVEEDVCRFRINKSRLSDPESLAGVMAHEVARAYRQHLQLQVSDREKEERLTDLTTVFLGFGILSANNAFRHHAAFHGGRHAIWREGGGELSSEEMCFLLAAQIALRTSDATYLRKLDRLLERELARCFDHGYGLLADDEYLHRTLGIPQDSHPTRPTAPQLERLPWYPEGIVGQFWGRVGYRVRPPRAHLGAVIGLLVGYFLYVSLRPAWGNLGPLGPTLLSIGLGAIVGHRWHRDRCARCQMRLLPTDTECPRCLDWFFGVSRRPIKKFGEGQNRGMEVARAHRSLAWRFGLRGLLWGYPALAGLARLTGGLDSNSPMAVFPFIVGAACAFVGRRFPWENCPVRGCEAPLEPFMMQCPRCLADLSD